MSGLIPPIIPIPGEGWRQYPSPLPGDEAPVPGESAPLATEEDVIPAREAERRRREDLVDLLVEDHQTTDGLLAALTDPATAPERRRDVAEVVVAELSRRIALERRFLAPLVRQAAGRAEAEQLLAELVDLEGAVRELQERTSRSGTDPAGVSRWCAELRERVAARAEDQQRRLFPRLREATEREKLREAARRARDAKDSVPTRPHPHAPVRPPWSRVTGPVMGVADRIRDEVTRRPTEPRDLR